MVEANPDAAELPNEQWIGIDLGTTNTCCGIWVTRPDGRGDVQIIQDQFGKFTMPSAVAYKDTDTLLVGSEAVNQSILNNKCFLYDAKRLIGRDYEDPKIGQSQ